MATNEETEFNETDAAPEVPADGYGDGSEESLVVTEEKKPINRSTLVVFAVLVIGAAGLYIMYRKTGPQSANAAVVQATDDAKKTINTFLTTGEERFKTMEQRLQITEKQVQQLKFYPSATQIPLADLQTNPFRLHPPEAKKPDNSAALSDAAEKKRLEEERLSIRQAVEKLQVQSIMCSDTRKACMINNTLYREGQSIDNFIVEKISPSTVLVKNGIYRFELRMQR